MIKKLLVPTILAIVVSLAGSAGFTVMKARTMHAEYLLVQDSLAVLAMDSAAHADDSTGDGSHGEDADGAHDGADTSAAHGDEDAHAPSLEHATTPADSIRALIAEREARGETSPKANASGGSAGTNAARPPASAGASSHETSSDDHGDAADSSAHTAAGSEAVVPPPVVSKPIEKPVPDILPERRLAKIFSAMSARDAAKVLAQMSDGDIRTILSMMGDRQAAAVLTALPPERAAAVSRGRTPPIESVTP